MGFGAGFAAGFVPAYQAQKDRSHERETDEFRYRMETLIKKKDKYDEYKKQDAQYASQATDLAQLYGQPPEAAADIYKMLRNETPKEVIIDSLKGGKYRIKAAAEQTEEAPQDTQMKEAGLATETTEPAAPAAPAFDGGGMLQKVFPGMKKFVGPGRQARQDARVQKASGMTPEEMAQVDAGFTPEPIPESGLEYVPSAAEPTNTIEAQLAMDEANRALAQNPDDPDLQAAAALAKAQYQSVVQAKTVEGKVSDVGQAAGSLGTIEVTAIGPDGKRVPILANSTVDGFTDQEGNPLQGARAMTKQEVEMSENIQQTLTEPAMKHQEAASNLGQAYTYFGNAQAVIKANPDVLQERASGLTAYFDDLGRDIATGMKIVGEAIANPEAADPAQLEDMAKKTEAAMNDSSLDEIHKLSAAKAYLDVQYALAAYHVAASKGQAGAKLSEKEREMLMSLPNKATTEAVWTQVVGALLVPTKQALDKDAKMIPQSHPMYQPFVNRYEYSPVGEFNPMEKYLEGTPGADLDRTLPQSGYAVVAPEQKDTVPKPEDAAPAEYPGYEYTGKMTPDGKKLYKDAQGNVGTMD